jgi:protein-S-isoprenylcysteine O-methyltransferase Ste14
MNALAWLDATPMESPYYVACLVGVMSAWFAFTAAFVLFKQKTPGGAQAAQPAPAVPAAPATRDRRSLYGILLQGVGFFFMWLSFRPPFAMVSRLPGPLALVLGAFAVVLAWSSAAFAVWAQRTLGKEWSYEARLVEGHRLVTAGPYAIVRHPIYSAMLGLWLATALAVARPWGLVLGLVPMLVGTWIRVRSEDRLLRGAFGDGFETWARRVPAVVPFLRGA